MDWGWFSTPLGLAIIAPGGAFLGALLGVGITSWTTRAVHKDRIKADRILAERKVDADIALAKAKFKYDRDQTIFIRRFQLAEQMLSDAYRFRSMMVYVRNGFSFSGEADSRKANSVESDATKNLRDSYFVPQVRLQAENEFISNMFARRTQCHVNFGADAEKAFELCHRSIHEVRTSSALLVEWAGNDEGIDRETIRDMQGSIWQQQAIFYEKDRIGNRIEEAVLIFEQISKPILGWNGES